MLNEDDIRRVDAIKSHVDSESDWLKQFKNSDGLVKDEYLMPIDCPCCGGNQHLESKNNNGFKISKCQHCGTEFVNPTFLPEHLEAYYSGEARGQYWRVIGAPTSQKNRMEKIWKPRVFDIVSRIENFDADQAKKAVLDVGCATGQFLSFWDKKEWNVEGVEPSKVLAEMASQSLAHASIHNQVFETFTANENSYDVITMWEVLEHVTSPFEVLRKTSNLIKPGGIIVVSVPNLSGFDVNILASQDFYYGAPSHLNYFRFETISQLFDRSGLRVIEQATPGQLDVSIIRNRMENDPQVLQKLGSFFYDRIREGEPKFVQGLQNFIKHNNLSSHMVIYGVKA